MKLLVIDDAYDMVVSGLRKEGFDLISCGATFSALEGAAKIAQHQSEADFILLDMQLGEDNEAGVKIAGLLTSETKAKVVAITGESLAKQVFRSLGIKHTPDKSVAEISGCLTGKCACGEKKGTFLESKVDVLIAWDSEPVRGAFNRVFRTIASQLTLKHCGVKADELITALKEFRPKVVFYTISYGDRNRFNPMRIAEHDYKHLRFADPSLPEFDELFGKAIMVGDFPEEKAEADQLGHGFLCQPISVPDMLAAAAQIKKGFEENRPKELMLRAMPALKSDRRDELVEIARTMSPTSAKNVALELTHDEKLAKACRWLSILRRDCGKEEFERVVSQTPQA